LVRVVFNWYGFEYNISADGGKRRIFGKAITFSNSFSASLEPPHFVVEAFVR
jgi:hypothetical protein